MGIHSQEELDAMNAADFAADKLDAEVCAEIFGLRVRERREGPCTYFDREWDDGTLRPVPRYSRDIAMTWVVENAIERQGLQKVYLDALWEWALEYAEVWTPVEYRTRLMWAYFHAGPEQRCRAALTAVRAEEGK